ncbi:MAG: OmpA/MotB family protein [Gammaproteobacteria bacterium]
MAAVINALARLPQRKLPAQDASILLAHTPRRATDHAEVFALADVLANVSHAAPANEDEIWMISYMDIMTVLLTLFVLLLAVAKTTPDALSRAARETAAHKADAKSVPRAVAIAGKVATNAPVFAQQPSNRLGTAATTGPGSQTKANVLVAPILKNVATALPIVMPAPATQPTVKPWPAVHAAKDLLSALRLNPLTAPNKMNPLLRCCSLSLRETTAWMQEVGQRREQLPRVGVREFNGLVLDPLILSLSRGERGLILLDALNVYPRPAVSPLRITAGAIRVATATANGPSAAIDSAVAANPRSAASTSARDKLLDSLHASPLGQRIETTVDQDNVSLEISDNILFDTGSASLKKRGQAVLDELAALLATQNYTVSVEGHSDDVAFESAAFASNWELSATRATHVTRYLITHGIAAGRLRAIGYADTHPRADNSSAEGRARNRRVSLVLHLPLSPVLPADH